MGWLSKAFSKAVDQAVKASGGSEVRASVAPRATSKSYPVPLVGEQHYEPTVELLKVGERVFIRHQPDNPYDPQALVAVDVAGDVIGYVPRDNFLRGAVFDQGKGCTATVRSLEEDERGHGFIHVYLDVELCAGPIDTCEYVAKP